MDKLRAMMVFREIATRGSLSAAAGALAISLPAVVRTLASLEKSLGVRLIDRTTRRMALTDDGRKYLDCVTSILTLVDDADRQFAKSSGELSGSLSVTAPVMFGQLHVIPLLQEFCAKHPGVSLSVNLSDGLVNLIEDSIDVAVRIGEFSQSAYRTVKAASVRRVVCASPFYLSQQGEPQEPRELFRHRCIQFSGVTPVNAWKLSSGNGLESFPIRYTMRTNDCRAALSACMFGLGLCSFLDYQVRARIADGSLTEVLADYRPPPSDVNVVYRNSRHLTKRVSAVVEHLRDGLAQSLPHST